MKNIFIASLLSFSMVTAVTPPQSFYNYHVKHLKENHPNIHAAIYVGILAGTQLSGNALCTLALNKGLSLVSNKNFSKTDSLKLSSYGIAGVASYSLADYLVKLIGMELPDNHNNLKVIGSFIAPIIANSIIGLSLEAYKK